MDNHLDTTFVIDGKKKASVEDVLAIGRGRQVKLSDDAKYHNLLRESKVVLLEHMEGGKKVYGATTSYGDAVTTVVHYKRSIELNFAALYNSGCGIGPLFPEETCRAIMFARLLCIAKGNSGVSIDMLKQMELYLKKGIIPAIPEEGSVGASGDLIPMSYIAAALIGERQVYYEGKVQETKDVLAKLGIKPHSFGPKEALSIINSTNVMSVVACQAWHRAEYYSRMAGRITSLISLAMLGNKEHFHPNLFAVRLQKGPAEVANWVYTDLANYALRPDRLQDRYSIRCAPHVIGVLRDALIWTRRDIEDEVNTTNDNPIIDVPNREIYYGGHFYGGYITFAMDSMVAAAVSVADLLERQMSQIVDYKFNNGLPPNLSGASPEKLPVSLAYKNLQIALSSYVAEASKLTIPTGIFSRSTESHNQDKVSMGTIAARYALRVMTLCEQVTAGCLLSVIQAIDLRLRDGQLKRESMGPELSRFFDEFRKEFTRMEEDRDLEDDLRRCMARVQEQKWQPYLESRIC